MVATVVRKDARRMRQVVRCPSGLAPGVSPLLPSHVKMLVASAGFTATTIRWESTTTRSLRFIAVLQMPDEEKERRRRKLEGGVHSFRSFMDAGSR